MNLTNILKTAAVLAILTPSLALAHGNPESSYDHILNAQYHVTHGVWKGIEDTAQAHNSLVQAYHQIIDFRDTHFMATETYNNLTGLANEIRWSINDLANPYPDWETLRRHMQEIRMELEVYSNDMQITDFKEDIIDYEPWFNLIGEPAQYYVELAMHYVDENVWQGDEYTVQAILALESAHMTLSRLELEADRNLAYTISVLKRDIETIIPRMMNGLGWDNIRADLYQLNQELCSQEIFYVAE